MELIFENVAERDEFFMDHCPNLCGGREPSDCKVSCNKCWEQSGVKYRIKNQPTPDHPVPIEEQDGYELTVIIDEPLRAGDRLIKKDGVWCVEKQPEPYLKVDVPKPDITPNEYWMDKKVEDYIREVTRGDIQMLVMPGRAQGKTEMRRRMEEAQQRLIMENSVFGVSGPVSTYSVLAKLDYEYRHNKNWKEALDIFMDKHNRKPQIEKVIFNDPATIVFWKDHTKTVVKVRKGDKFDPEKGLAMAIAKKVLADSNGEYWVREFQKWLPEEKESAYPWMFLDEMHEVFSRATDLRNKLHTQLAKGFNVPVTTFDSNRFARECSHFINTFGSPVIQPLGVVKINASPDPEPLEPCEDCKHEDVHEFEEPCASCRGNSNFVKKEEKKEPFIKICATCKYAHRCTAIDPCASCKTFSKWEKADE